MPSASEGSTIAGWHSAAALKGVFATEVVSETILPPQQKPITPHVLIEGLAFSTSFRKEGTLEAVAGGAPVVWKKFPRALPFSSVLGGYLLVHQSLNLSSSAFSDVAVKWAGKQGGRGERTKRCQLACPQTNQA